MRCSLTTLQTFRTLGRILTSCGVMRRCGIAADSHKIFLRVAGGLGWRKRRKPQTQYQVTVMTTVAATRISGMRNSHSIICGEAGIRPESRIAGGAERLIDDGECDASLKCHGTKTMAEVV